MSLMDRIAKLDSAMQRGLDNGFARVFGGKVVPAEIEELLKQETEDNLVHAYEGGVEAPNVYRVRVSPKDASNLETQNPKLATDFADQLTRFHRNNGWVSVGPVVVVIEEDTSMRTGQLRAQSAVDPSPTMQSSFARQSKPQEPPAPPAPQPPTPEPTGEPAVQESQPVVNLLLQDGSSRTYVVQEGSNIIGRANEADLRLPDTGVSRQHAEVTWDGEAAVLTDLHSTNGTTVNDMRVENWLLADGDVITIGHSNIEVRITQPTQDQ